MILTKPKKLSYQILSTYTCRINRMGMTITVEESNYLNPYTADCSVFSIHDTFIHNMKTASKEIEGCLSVPEGIRTPITRTGTTHSIH